MINYHTKRQLILNNKTDSSSKYYGLTIYDISLDTYDKN
jgi:hypothetical protein